MPATLDSRHFPPGVPSMRRSRLLPAALTLALACSAALHAQTKNPPDANVERQTTGNRVTENVPPLPPELVDTLNRYQNTRGATVAGWLDDGCLLISTRFAETARRTASARRWACASSSPSIPSRSPGSTPAPVGNGGARRLRLRQGQRRRRVLAVALVRPAARARPRCSPTASAASNRGAAVLRTTAASSPGAAPRATARTPTSG